MSEPVKSSFCDRGDCVVVTPCGYGDVIISSTLNDGQLYVTAGEWEAFLASAKTGEFDNV